MIYSLPKINNTKKIKAIAVLTSGGDAPGMNAAIRAVVRFGISVGIKVYGIQKGFSGLLEGQIEELNVSSVANIIHRGGTILRTDRCKAFFDKGPRREAANLLRRKGIDGLVVIGGDGSFRGVHALEEENDFPTIGIPGTIDNDIPGTDDTIGFDTAVNTGVQAIDRIRDTANSHDRIFIVEVMGRTSGFIASYVGIGGGAETIFVPEVNQSVKTMIDTIDRGVKRGKTSSILVVAEGGTPTGREDVVKRRSSATQKNTPANLLTKSLRQRGFSPRLCILGHTQRGGAPTAHDRYLASALGAASICYLISGKSNAFVGIQRGDVALVPYKEILNHHKVLPKDVLTLASRLAI